MAGTAGMFCANEDLFCKETAVHLGSIVLLNCRAAAAGLLLRTRVLNCLIFGSHIAWDVWF